LLHLGYLSYYPIIFSVPFFLYRARRFDDFSEAVFTVMLTFVACFALYIVFPVAGPRYEWNWPTPELEGPIRRFTVWLLQARSSRGTAFPSSHVAVSVAQSGLAVRYFGGRGWLVALLTVGLSIGAVYGGFHYGVDVFAGVATAIVTTIIAMLLYRRAPSAASQANAIAPT
jgi:membrane-associated phospholipid phosphatase